MSLFVKNFFCLAIFALAIFFGGVQAQTNTCQIFLSKNIAMGNAIEAKTVAKQSVNINVECTTQSTEWKLTGSPSSAFKIGTAALAGTTHYAMAFVDSGYTKPLAANKWDVRGVGNQTVALYVGVGQQTAGNPQNNGLNVIADAGWFNTSIPISLSYLDQTQQGNLIPYGFVLTKCQIPSTKNLPMGTTIQAGTVAKKSVSLNVQCTAQSTEWKITGNPSNPFKIGNSVLTDNNHYAVAFVDSGYTKPLATNKWDVRGAGDQTVILYIGVGQQKTGSPQNNGLNVIADAGWFSTTIPLEISF